VSTFSELASLGTVLSAFDQTSFRGTTTQVAGENITDGYCAGVCLDWMRRALLSGANRNQGFLGYEGTRAKGRTDGTVERMGIACKAQAPTYVKETDLQLAVKLLAVLRNGREETYTIRGTARTGVPIPTNQAKVLLELWDLAADLDLTKSPAGVLSKQRLNNLYERALTRTDRQKTTRIASTQKQYGSAGAWSGELRASGFERDCCTIFERA